MPDVLSPYSHSGHDYEALLNGWKSLGLDRRELIQAGGYPVIVIESKGTVDNALPIYISAGVHGDECAPVWGLLQWAVENQPVLANHPFLIFPCLNPAGLVANTRHDGENNDLNRNFDNITLPLIAAWQKAIAGRQFQASLNLHEDYDTTGIYLYEIGTTHAMGRKILDSCAELIPCEPLPDIDGQEFENGLKQHTGDSLREVVEEELGGGYPEAIYLALHHAETAITFETPSELDLLRRIAAQKRAVETFVGSLV